jgi:hypothetical protein
VSKRGIHGVSFDGNLDSLVYGQTLPSPRPSRPWLASDGSGIVFGLLNLP